MKEWKMTMLTVTKARKCNVDINWTMDIEQTTLCCEHVSLPPVIR